MISTSSVTGAAATTSGLDTFLSILATLDADGVDFLATTVFLATRRAT
jgi:hypothetical protein